MQLNKDICGNSATRKQLWCALNGETPRATLIDRAAAVQFRATIAGSDWLPVRR